MVSISSTAFGTSKRRCSELFSINQSTISEEAKQAAHRNIIDWSKDFIQFPDDAKAVLTTKWGIDLRAPGIVVRGLDHVRIDDDFYVGCGQCNRMANTHFQAVYREAGKIVTWGDE